MSDEPIVITKKSTIGEIFSQYRETQPVFLKYFGSGCFTCLGSMTEDIVFGAMMRNAEPQQIIDALNEAIKNGAEGSTLLLGFFMLFINSINSRAIGHLIRNYFFKRLI